MELFYYYEPADKELSAEEVKIATGVNPENFGSEGLIELGVYLVETDDNEPVQPFNTDLYSLTASYNLNGNKAEKLWAPVAKTLSEVLEDAKELRKKSIQGRLETLQKVYGFKGLVLLAVASQLAGDRSSRFTDWVSRAQSTVTELDTDLTSIESAVTADEINNIVSPAWGFYSLRLDKDNPLNLLAGDFGAFYSKDYQKSDLELFFPSTNTTVSYSSGFAATPSVVTSTDNTFQIRVASTGIVVDEKEIFTEDSAEFSATSGAYKEMFGYVNYVDDPDRLSSYWNLQSYR